MSQVRLGTSRAGVPAVVVDHVRGVLGLLDDVVAETDAHRTAKRHRQFRRGSAPSSASRAAGKGCPLLRGYSPALAPNLSFAVEAGSESFRRRRWSPPRFSSTPVPGERTRHATL